MRQVGLELFLDQNLHNLGALQPGCVCVKPLGWDAECLCHVYALRSSAALYLRGRAHAENAEFNDHTALGL